MTPLARKVLLILVALLALGAGYLISREQRSAALDSAAVEELLSLSLEDASGKRQALRQWRGKLMVVNFWATWCPPCLKEIPGFSRLQRKLSERGVQFVGIGIDSPDKIREFAGNAPVSYPLLIGAADTLGVARKLGNRSDGLPYTVVLDRKGGLLATRLGEWNEADLEAFLAKTGD